MLSCSSTLIRVLGAAIASAGLAGLATAQCNSYTISQSTGAAIVPGTTDAGNHGDDTASPLSCPSPSTSTALATPA